MSDKIIGKMGVIGNSKDLTTFGVAWEGLETYSEVEAERDRLKDELDQANALLGDWIEASGAIVNYVDNEGQNRCECELCLSIWFQSESELHEDWCLYRRTQEVRKRIVGVLKELGEFKRKETKGEG